MIDLHLHLDGSLAPEQVISLARLQGVSLPAWFVMQKHHKTAMRRLRRYGIKIACGPGRPTRIVAI